MFFNFLLNAARNIVLYAEEAVGQPDVPSSPFTNFLQRGTFGKLTDGLDPSQYQPFHYIMLVLFILTLILVPYLLGSFNFSIIASNKVYKDDVRQHGSGNAGLTNMYRTWGGSAAVYTLVGDSLKAVISVVLGYLLLGYNGAYLAALFCMLGHMFPLYFKFKGGKGVLTVAVSILLLDPLIFLILFIIFIIIVASTKYVSMGSVMGMLLYPFVLSNIRGYGTPIIFSFLISGFVIFMHRANIKRIWDRTEAKFTIKRKADAADTANDPQQNNNVSTSAGKSKKSKKER